MGMAQCVLSSQLGNPIFNRSLYRDQRQQIDRCSHPPNLPHDGPLGQGGKSDNLLAGMDEKADDME